jgi:aconitate hydratase
MGVLPLEFRPGESRASLGLKGDETVDIALPEDADVDPRQDLVLKIHRADDTVIRTTVRSRLDTETEIDYFRCGGILQYVLNRRLEAA